MAVEFRWLDKMKPAQTGWYWGHHKNTPDYVHPLEVEIGDDGVWVRTRYGYDDADDYCFAFPRILEPVTKPPVAT